MISFSSRGWNIWKENKEVAPIRLDPRPTLTHRREQARCTREGGRGLRVPVSMNLDSGDDDLSGSLSNGDDGIASTPSTPVYQNVDRFIKLIDQFIEDFIRFSKISQSFKIQI
jgi:hypothetical protein